MAQLVLLGTKGNMDNEQAHAPSVRIKALALEADRIKVQMEAHYKRLRAEPTKKA
jgi:hypothetical protein